MDKDSVLYQLMELRINTILNSILATDKDYQDIIQKSNKYTDQLDSIGLPTRVRSLIDGYISEHNALCARYGAIAYQLGFSDCIELSRSRMDINACAKAVFRK